MGKFIERLIRIFCYYANESKPKMVQVALTLWYKIIGMMLVKAQG